MMRCDLLMRMVRLVFWKPTSIIRSRNHHTQAVAPFDHVMPIRGSGKGVHPMYRRILAAGLLIG